MPVGWPTVAAGPVIDTSVTSNAPPAAAIDLPLVSFTAPAATLTVYVPRSAGRNWVPFGAATVYVATIVLASPEAGALVTPVTWSVVPPLETVTSSGPMVLVSTAVSSVYVTVTATV